MRYMKMIAVLLVPLVLLLAGCGGGSSGTTAASNPFTTNGGGTSGGSGSTVSQGGAIIFTSSAGAKPGSQVDLLTPLSSTVDPTKATLWEFQQLVPFLLTDSSGNPRTGVPVTLSLYSINGDPTGVTIDFLVRPISEPNQQTVTTDSAGMGIFNVSVILAVNPTLGLNNLETLVFKAVTKNDAVPVVAYAGNSYNVISAVPISSFLLQINPFFSSFGATTNLALTVSGGIPPYVVSSSNTALVTATLSGNNVLVHLVDTTAWTGDVGITVTDSSSNSATAFVSR
jgi:hypothetical protein